MDKTGYSWVIVRGILICFIALIIAFPSQLFLPHSYSWGEIEFQRKESGWIKKKGRVNSGLNVGLSLKKEGRKMIDAKGYGIFPLAIAAIPRIRETREGSRGMIPNPQFKSHFYSLARVGGLCPCSPRLQPAGFDRPLNIGWSMRWNLLKQTINATRQLLWNLSQALQKLMEKQWTEEIVPSPKK